MTDHRPVGTRIPSSPGSSATGTAAALDGEPAAARRRRPPAPPPASRPPPASYQSVGYGYAEGGAQLGQLLVPASAPTCSTR